MISVDDARARILANLPTLPAEWVGLTDADGRVLADDIAARRTQPPADLSAMDGWAVRAADTAPLPATLTEIGESAAGHGFDGSISPGQTVRIFTGAPVPPGADAILIQENASQNGDQITVNESVEAGRYIRPAGFDFREGETGLSAGHAVSPRDIGLLAAMNVPWVPVRRRPRIALLSSGDELVRPGEHIGPNQIVSSNGLAIAAFVRRAGGIPVDLGIAADTEESVQRTADAARNCDMLVTLGGASVGKHDLIQDVLAAGGEDLQFWKIAMRPGKPVMFGEFRGMPLLGLPGNPVSSIVCALMFLRPAIAKMMAQTDADALRLTAPVARDIPENDQRAEYMRARLIRSESGQTLVEPFSRQDSSMLSVLSSADALAFRPAHAPAFKTGDMMEYIPLNGIL